MRNKPKMKYCYSCQHFVQYYIKLNGQLYSIANGRCLHPQKRISKWIACEYWEQKAISATDTSAEYFAKTIGNIHSTLNDLLLYLSPCEQEATDE